MFPIYSDQRVLATWRPKVMSSHLTMRTVFMSCCVLTFLPILFKIVSGVCAKNCPCRDTGNNYTVCKFERDLEANITSNVFFDSPVEYIRRLRLEFNTNLTFYSLYFPFKTFFQLGFMSLVDLCIVSDRGINAGATFRMEDLEDLLNLSSFTFQVEEMKMVPASISLLLNLRYLDVSFSRLINFAELCKIVKVSGTTLEEVYAEGINYDGSWESLTTTLDDTFFSCFNQTNLRVLHIPKSNLKQISSPNINLFVPSLEVVDLSHNDAFIDMKTYLGAMKLDKLKEINILGIQFVKNRLNRNCEDDTTRQTRFDNPLCYYLFLAHPTALFHSLEVVNFGGSNDCKKMNSFYCEHQSQCIFPRDTVLRELYLDHICIIRIDMHVSGLNRLEKLDLSSNLCEYISSLAFSEMSSLTTLLLNGNSLSKMEETDPDELRILFQENRNLRTLNLSGNGFTRLHSDIFTTNTKLETLDLSENFLHNTDWLSSTLMQLSSLNLKGNRLMTIDSRTRQIIDNFLHGYNYSVGDVDGIHINLANNPISCGCDQEGMLRWLSNTKRYISDINGIVCVETGGFLSIYTDDIESLRHNCNFQRYKGLLALSTIPILVAICVVLYIRYYRHILRIRRIRKHLNEFVRDNFQVHRRFLLYLAYSFSDSDTVLNIIFPELEKRLQKEVEVNKNLVCISDRDFNVGVSISDEIINAVTSSSVVLFIISKEFARSRWCEFEAEIALYEGKPIILVTLGDVKIRSLPSSLRKVCFKWTRLEWPGTKNQEKLEDFWGKLMKAVMKYTDAIKY